MYLKKITLKNIKSFADFTLDFSNGKESVQKWTTIFGENGLGKSTLLQAIGVALAGPSAVRELLPVAENWVRHNKPYGEIIAELMWTEGDALTPISGFGRQKTKSPYIARFLVTGDNPEQLPEETILPDRLVYTTPIIVPWSGDGTPKQRGDATKDRNRLLQTAYSEDKRGWLACGYGPFRRLSGGGQDADRILYRGRISARFITLFREDAGLTNVAEWLIGLYNTSRDGDKRNERALNYIKRALAQELFPEPIDLVVDARSVLLEINGRAPIPINDLSDGYRSMLALGLDLLRWLLQAFPDLDNPIENHGVVLIDELDAHLHPKWQREIGHWLRNKFKNIQFIVATHSPFIAQVAEVERSGLLPENEYPQTSGNVVLEQTAEGVIRKQGIEPVQDYRVDQILMTPLFDMDALYSPVTMEHLEKHQELFQKKSSGTKLSTSEEHLYEQLSFWRENLPVLTAPEERAQEQKLTQAINRYSEQLAKIE